MAARRIGPRERQAARAAEEEQLRLEQEQSGEDIQPLPDPDKQENSALPQKTNDAPRRETRAAPPPVPAPAPAPAPAVAAAPFAERIRAVLETPDLEDLTAAPDTAPVTNPSNSLPPLDPPVSIEDLLTRDVGSPLVLPGAQ